MDRLSFVECCQRDDKLAILLQADLDRVQAELLILQQAPPTSPQPILAPISGDSGAEAKLREQLRRQDKMVRSLRDVIKQLGMPSPPTMLCLVVRLQCCYSL